MRICALDPVRACVLALGLLAVGCGGGKSDEKADEKTAEKADEKTDDAGADEDADGGVAAVPSTTAMDDGEAPPAEGGETGAASAEAGEAGETGAASGDEAAADDTAAAAVAPEEQVKTLLAEVTNKKTKDDRALAALDEAKALQAAARDLAKAANKRGQNLLTSPDRATAFFEWAAAADPKYPDATFNLAKLAANTGDIPRVKELLTEVKARGGKKLLQQIEFDPSFALVADDPEVLSLLR